MTMIIKAPVSPTYPSRLVRKLEAQVALAESEEQVARLLIDFEERWYSYLVRQPISQTRRMRLSNHMVESLETLWECLLDGRAAGEVESVFDDILTIYKAARVAPAA